MANLKISTTIRNNMMDEISSFLGASAVLKIMSGTQPAGGGAETTVLAQLTCDVSAFAAAAASGVLTLNGITADTSAAASGVATWFRLETSGGSFGIDGDISTVADGTGDMQLDDVNVVLNGTVAMTGPNTFTAPNAA